MIDPNRLNRTHVVNVQGRKDEFVVILHSPRLVQKGVVVREAETFEVSWNQWVASKAKAEDF